MEVGIITAHCSCNPGASLQAHAMCKMIAELGHNPVMIDYRPWFFQDIVERAQNKNISSRDQLKMLILGQRLKERYRLFQQFERDFYPEKTSIYRTNHELKAAPPKLEAYLCGSDQIWNPQHIHYTDAYFLGFAKELPSIKASYAASIGQDMLCEKDDAFLLDQVNGLDYVSVREDIAVSLLKRDIGINMRVEQHVDPTLLFPAEYWREIALPPKVKLPETFFLFYPLQNNPISEQLLLAIKQETGLPCVSICSSLRNQKGIDMQIPIYGPREFVYLLDHAKITLTNSFHGVVFSILLQSELVAYRNPVRNSRIESLLRLLKKEELQVSSLNEYYERDWPAIWGRADDLDTILKKERLRSEAYLRRVLS